MRRLTRREFLRAGELAAAACVVAACAPAATPQVVKEIVKETVVVEGTPKVVEKVVTKVVQETVVVKEAPKEPVVLEWWPGWPGNWMLAVAKLFEDANEGIKLNPVLNYPEKQQVLAAVAAGTTPDLIEDVAYMELIVRDVFLPIDDRLAQRPDLSITDGDIPKPLWEVFAWEGEHYGVPSVDTAGREGMGINVRVAQEAGLDPTNPPRTWDEAFEWHKKMTQYDSAGNLLVLGFDPMAERTGACTEGDPFMWPHMWGFKYIENRTFDVDRPETVDFLTVIKRFADDVGVEKIDGLNTAFSGMSRGPFGQGKVGIRITYPSGPAGVYKVNPKDEYMFTWVPMPEDRRDITVQTAGGHAGMIMKLSQHPDEAFKLAVFLTEDAACNVFFKEVGWIGPRKSWQANVDLSSYPDHVAKSIKWFTDSMTQSDEVWWNTDPIEGITQDEWQKAYEAVRHDQITPDAAAKQMQDNLTKAIDVVFAS